ncbi:cobalt transporter CbiM [Halanaerocella petrolearia]
MHISEGILSLPVLTSGAVVAVGGITTGLKRMSEEELPQVAIIAAALFISSLIRIPLGPTNIHLILNGIAGILLGWSSFPAFFIALLLQSILFQFGGLTTLGVNTIVMALPAIISYYLFKGLIKIKRDRLWLGVSSFLVGAIAVLLSSLLMAGILTLVGESFVAIAKLVIVSQLPLLIVEGIISSFTLLFLSRVRPNLLEE